MRFVEDRSGLPAPGICFVCETAPQEGAVDTLRNFTPGFPVNLAGAKIICQGCLQAAGNVAGLESGTQVEDANLRAEQAEARYNAIRQHVEAVRDALQDEKVVAVADRAPEIVSFESIKTTEDIAREEAAAGEQAKVADDQAELDKRLNRDEQNRQDAAGDDPKGPPPAAQVNPPGASDGPGSGEDSVETALERDKVRKEVTKEASDREDEVVEDREEAAEDDAATETKKAAKPVPTKRAPAKSIKPKRTVKSP